MSVVVVVVVGCGWGREGLCPIKVTMALVEGEEEVEEVVEEKEEKEMMEEVVKKEIVKRW
ncbi:hypothetical protein E2C01_019588 [Portunus trituberculatus]|uniref:Uncharacterized protein n=1 Tax=Portunus trituberculatus TaxID=210409 RepID=A0A5B7DZ92_PORTR|nr:hypothetical protein [Portunus trituberculatus]